MSKSQKWKDCFEVLSKTQGGNADVYFVKHNLSGKRFALKELRFRKDKNGKRKYKEESRIRFKNEVTISRENSATIPGIIPIDYYCEQDYWYTMPVAKPIMKYIEDKEIKEIILGVVQLTETLEALHNKGISHRDIKPANIYFYKDRFFLGDFGLVNFPDKIDNLTRSDRGLGAIFTIAPEMKRSPRDADGMKADVFSLAKSMWMFLSRDEKGFDGVYNYMDSSHSLRFQKRYRDIHMVEIDELLMDATDNNPATRPTIKEFKERLINWIEIYSDMDKSQASDWNFLSKQLFGSNPPESSSWTKGKDIIEILNIVGRTPAYNHMFFHSKGGLDFSHAEPASENECIKLYDTMGFCYVVKPKFLYFEGFGEEIKWNYFLLELDELNPIIESSVHFDYEHLIEVGFANYVSAEFAQYGVYDYDTGDPLPKEFKIVNRYIKGKFLIVLKSGPYNRIGATYDGRHGDCSASEFKKYIASLIKGSKEFNKYARQNDKFRHLSEAKIEDIFIRSKELKNNPFKRMISEKNIKNVIEDKSIEIDKTELYIRAKYAEWNFESVLQICEFHPSVKVKFYFTFTILDDYRLIGMLKEGENCICNDGYIRKLDSNIEDKCYFVYDRNLAITIKEKLQNKVSDFLMENGLQSIETFDSNFSIKLIRTGKPNHLFTKEEIEKEMRNADDRVNNQLVIDENGYPRVITNTDISMGHLFPVRHETWSRGNMYVGKYSKLLSLDDNYISSLQGWLLYLKSGRTKYMDYVHENTNEEELLKEIKEYY